MPKSLYKVLRLAATADNQANPNPILFTPAISIQTSAQVSDYLLCKDCEGRLSSRGEKWIVENCWRSADNFPLRTMLENAEPMHVGKSDLAIYAGWTINGIDIPRVVYFGASVFWRAAARKWSPIVRQVPTTLDLGPYREEFRMFLLDEVAFPKNAALLVTVSSTKDEGANEGVLFPYHSKKESGCNQYRFLIPGIIFQLFVGKTMPVTLRACCVAQSDRHPIFFGPTDFLASDMWKLMSRGIPKGTLARK
jgi:hypothetical protein